MIENHGINDQYLGATPEEYRATLRALAPRVTLWQTPVRSAEPWWRDEFAQVMREVATESGADVAEVHEYTRGRVDLLSDDVHPSAEGYRLIFQDVLAPVVAKQVAALKCTTVELAKDLLGHKSIRMTEVYVDGKAVAEGDTVRLRS